MIEQWVVLLIMIFLQKRIEYAEPLLLRRGGSCKQSFRPRATARLKRHCIEGNTSDSALELIKSFINTEGMMSDQ